MAFYDSLHDGNDFVISFKKNHQQDFGIFAKGYTRTASVLAEHLLEEPRFADYEAYPVVFLYRQAFELYLKGLYFRAGLISFFSDSRTVECNFIYKHRLVPLAKTFQEVCHILFPLDGALRQLSEKVLRYANEFEEIDKDSFGYRYPIDTKGNPSTKPHQVVNLFALHSSMKELLAELEIVDFGFDVEASQAQKIYEIIQNAETILASEDSEAG